MSITLNNLFAANISVKDLLSQANPSENAANLDLGQQAAENISITEIFENFSQTLAKKITDEENSDSSIATALPKAELTSEPDSADISQDLIAIAAVQNISIDAKIDELAVEIQDSAEIKISEITANVIETNQLPEEITLNESVEAENVKIQTDVPEISKENNQASITDTEVLPENQTSEQQSYFENEKQVTQLESTQIETEEFSTETPVINTAAVIQKDDKNFTEQIDNNEETSIEENIVSEIKPEIVTNKPEVQNNKIVTDAEPLNETVQPQNTSQEDNQHQLESSEVIQEQDSTTEAILFEPAEQKITQPQVQEIVEAVETVEKNNDAVDTPIENDLLISNNIPSSNTAEHTYETAEPSKAVDSETPASVTSQIQESIFTSYSADGREIVIRLSPPELGKVAIRFSEENNEIHGVMQVDELHTKNQIQKELPEIIQNLQENGILVKKIEVVLSNQQEQHTLKDQSSFSGQNSPSQQQSSPNHEPQRSGSVYSQWNAFAETVSNIAEPLMQFSGASINMLA
ncbi:MAG: hypothetical protein A2Y10_04690 [Planctomycetes bacterium GWF2_41_51]|nr:MAG: hypothetical protein A2Y10_04690 [Planctomycetes bacterium GWF2_41_51]